MTVTWLQSIAPSSGSLPVTVNGMSSPQLKKSPSSGVLIVNVGAVFPTVMVVVFVSVLPDESVTVSLTV